MTEAAPDRTDSQHSLDELFQLLVHARDKKPAIARAEILERLQRDQLRVDLHVRCGARTEYPMRQASWQERQGRVPIEAGMILVRGYLYGITPSEGITEPISFDAWGRLLDLVICDGRLIVEPR